jgi:hypothetical protein
MIDFTWGRSAREIVPGCLPCDGEVVLDRNWDARQRKLGEMRVVLQFFRLGERLLGSHGFKGADPTIERRNPVQVRAEDLNGRRLPGTHHPD